MYCEGWGVTKLVYIGGYGHSGNKIDFPARGLAIGWRRFADVPRPPRLRPAWSSDGMTGALLELRVQTSNVGGAFAFHEAGIETRIIRDATVDAEMRLHPLAACLAHGLLRSGVAREFEDRCAKSVWIARWNDKPGDAVDNRLGVAADIGHNHRQAGGHAFKDGIGEALLVRSEDADIGCGE